MTSGSSLPLRERGLKYLVSLLSILRLLSLPLRERGLKLFVKSQYYLALNVAPLAGAWIEIPSGVCMYAA